MRESPVLLGRALCALAASVCWGPTAGAEPVLGPAPRPAPTSAASVLEPASLPATSLPASQPASALASPTAAPRKNEVVLVGARNEPTRALHSLQALRGQLSDLPVVVRSAWIDQLPRDLDGQMRVARQVCAAGTLAVAWYDPAQQRMAVLVTSPDSVILRRAGGTGGEHEALAVVTRFVVDALLRGESVEGAVTVGPPRKVAPDIPAAERLRIEAAYALEGYASEARATHGLDAGLAARLVGPLWAALSYRVLPAIEVRNAYADSTIRRHPIALGLRWRWTWRRFGLEPALDLLLDYVTLSTVVADRTVIASSDADEVLLQIAPSCRIDLRLTRAVRGFLAAGAQVPLQNKRFVVGGVAGVHPLLSPWPVQPTLIVGAAVTLF